MIGVFEIHDETNLNFKHCMMLRTHHWIDMHIVIGRESANAKLWFKLSTLKNNKENARLYFNDLLRDQFSSVAQSCPTLYNPMDCSTPGFPVLHYLSESAWTHVHWVGDAIQPSHPLSSPSPPGSIFPRIRVFSNESVLHIRWPKYWRFSFSISSSNEYSGMISFRMEWLDLLPVQGTLKSLLQHHSSKASILQHSAFFIV